MLCVETDLLCSLTSVVNLAMSSLFDSCSASDGLHLLVQHRHLTSQHSVLMNQFSHLS